MAFSATPLVHASGNTTTSAIDTTGADLLVAFVGNYQGTIGISDSKGITWSALTIQTNVIEGKLFWAGTGSVGWAVGSGHTFTPGGTTGQKSIAVTAWSGAHATPFDVQNGTTASSATTVGASTSVTPTVGDTTPQAATWTFASTLFACECIAAFKAADASNDLIISGVSLFNPTTPAVGSPWTLSDEIHSGFLAVGLAYLIPTGGGGGGSNWGPSLLARSWNRLVQSD